jgi:hypothetical protein
MTAKTTKTTRHWLLVIEGDVYPMLIGPLDEHELLPRARKHRAEDPSAEDGLYALTLDAEDNLSIEGFSGEDLEDPDIDPTAT